MSRKSTKAKQMIIEKPKNEFDINYEYLGVKHFLENSPHEELNLFFGSTIPDIEKLKTNNTELSFWNSNIFDQNIKNYNEKLNLLQSDSKIESAGKCIFCGSDKTITTSKQTRGGDEGSTFFQFCTTCQRTKKN